MTILEAQGLQKFTPPVSEEIRYRHYQMYLSVEKENMWQLWESPVPERQPS